jgi:hypothetical protein
VNDQVQELLEFGFELHGFGHGVSPLFVWRSRGQTKACECQFFVKAILSTGVQAGRFQKGTIRAARGLMNWSVAVPP